MTTQLTPSQERAYGKLDFFFHLGLNGIKAVEGISPRTIPLIAGPSGSGKTFLVGTLARKYNLPFFSINIPNWIVRGAKNDSQITLEQLRDFISSNEKGVIFLDEVNKLMNSHLGQSAWTADIFTECIAFLDQDERLEAMGLSGLLEKLRQNFIIVGAAAFQDEWQQSQKQNSSIGFVASEQFPQDQESSFALTIQKQNTIPEELLFRFNDNLIVILPPTQEEYGRRIASLRSSLLMPELREEELSTLAATAVSSGKAMRWLEGYLTECLSQLSEEDLIALAAARNNGVVPTENTPSSQETAPPKRDRKQLRALRDASFDRFEESLKNLSVTSRKLHLLLEGVLYGYGAELNLSKRTPLSECITSIGECIAPEESCEHYAFILVRGLNYLADKGLRATSPVISSVERGKLGKEIERISTKISSVIPHLLAHCGESAEERAIREVALEFVVHTEGVHRHLQDIRAMDAEGGFR